MDLSDEAFVEQFVALSSGSLEPVDIPQQVTHQRTWEVCAIVKVITNKQVNLAQFSQNMLRIYGVHHQMELSILQKNTFLV